MTIKKPKYHKKSSNDIAIEDITQSTKQRIRHMIERNRERYLNVANDPDLWNEDNDFEPTKRHKHN